MALINMHYILINQNYTISIRLRTYSSFKAALTAGKVSMLGNCPNLVRDSLYVRFAALCLIMSAAAFLDLQFVPGHVLA